MPSTKTAEKPLRIGMVGGGKIGGGVYELLMGNASSNNQLPHLRRACIITKICVQDLSKLRSFHIDGNVSSLVTSFDSILNDDSIELVVEVMGGTTLAKTVIFEALKRGKSVVTANKGLIAECMEEIQSMLTTIPGSKFACEAAVCGGIPIIQILRSSCYAGDVIHQVVGVLNGTSNYVLGKIEQGVDFEEALMEAQDLGFAEPNPDADIEGYDVRAKIAILAKLAFGTTVTPLEHVSITGISAISPVDFQYAKLLNCTIKMLGTAQRMSSFAQFDGALAVYVSPVLVPNEHLLASTRGNGNCVAITSANMGTCYYAGPGAGRFPTANSVVADIVRFANNTPGSRDAFPLQSQIDLDFDYIQAFYIRIPFMDSIGIIRKVGELAENNDVSIYSILQNPIVDRMEADFCVTTESCKVSMVRAFCADLEDQDFVRGLQSTCLCCGSIYNFVGIGQVLVPPKGSVIALAPSLCIFLFLSWFVGPLVRDNDTALSNERVYCTVQHYDRYCSMEQKMVVANAKTRLFAKWRTS